VASPLVEIYEHLLAELGPQHWWPGETPFEVIVGAILVQNTNWQNVRRAIDNLRDEGLLEPRALHDLDVASLAELIRPAGYYRVKARRLRNFLDWLIDRHHGSLAAMFATSIDTLREELLTLNGIGPETADSILLYAGDLPVFVVDTYTHRICSRHGLIEFDTDYHAIQYLFQSGLPADVQVYNEYHALLVSIGKHYCRKRKPRCEACPMKEWLPEGGPLEPETFT